VSQTTIAVDDLRRRIRSTLEATGVAYELLACDPDLSDTAVFCGHYGHSLEDAANTLLVKARGADVLAPYVACVLLGHTRLDANQVLRKRLRARKVSFASPEETRAITAMELGGVTAFGLPEGLPLWVDAAVMRRPRLILGSGERASKILIAPEALARLPGAEVVQGLAREAG
jgi:prolyl-tRNA editing enzyme YbaK/EbsC (Cys-tRNA(Pro) deacylase)